MTTRTVGRLCLRSLERNALRTLAPVVLTIRVPGLGIEVHKSCDLTNLGVADEARTVHPRLIVTELKAAGNE